MVPTFTPSRMTANPTSWWSNQASSSSGLSVRSWSIQRIAFSTDSAVVRSGTSLKNATGCVLYHFSSASSRVLPCQGDDVGTWRVNTAPGTKRRSGSSVYSSIFIAPLRPCALVRRPTPSWVLLDIASLVIGVDNVDAHLAAVGESRDQGAERLRRAAGATDHAAKILGMHAHLENIATRRVL